MGRTESNEFDKYANYQTGRAVHLRTAKYANSINNFAFVAMLASLFILRL